MRSGVTKQKLQILFEELGKSAKGPGNVYIVGGSTALLLGIRDQTIDVDLKLDPEAPGIFERIETLKNQLNINIEIASPDQFIPALPGWRERSEFIAAIGSLNFYHYDFYGQVLAKIERGHEQDLSDATEMVKSAKVKLGLLLSLYEEIEPQLLRYPAINKNDFANKVKQFIKLQKEENVRG
ncbi:MAG: hypothetical protein GYA55_04515 [SAR324 cluster bacterium]|uniref:DUF6036 domain-containing protein n=1 Tax=SAR324 cluster bacterium TaxID=2024889 RepID=A0A7X9FRB3_9DELT|nr:hypothetical protein [SAR324 cluster bacterium]